MSSLKPSLARSSRRGRLVSLIVVVAIVAGVGALIAIDAARRSQASSTPPTDSSIDSAPGTAEGSSEPTPTSPTTTPAPASSTVSTASTVPIVAPACGETLPVTIQVEGATDGPNPGAAGEAMATEGQFVEHWQLPGGTIEVRWPPDPKPLGAGAKQPANNNPAAFSDMSAFPEHQKIRVEVPNLGGSIVLTSLTDQALPGACDVVQVRYADEQGNQTTLGYNLVDFLTDRGMGVDLNPLIISTSREAPPDPSSVYKCAGENDVSDGDYDHEVSGPPAPTPAEALLAFVSNHAPGDGGPPLPTSGYREYLDGDNRAVYAHSVDGQLVIRITVVRVGADWYAVNVRDAGC